MITSRRLVTLLHRSVQILPSPQPVNTKTALLLGSLAIDLHALSETVSDSTLAALLALSEGSTATEGTSKSLVTHTNNADVLNTGKLTIAGHAFGHLDLHGVVGVGRDGKTRDTRSRDVVDDLGSLEGLVIGATGGAVNGGSHGTSTILVDLGKKIHVSYNGPGMLYMHGSFDEPVCRQY